MPRLAPGVFFIGTDTGVGKTYVAALVARQLAAEKVRVGVYKPVATGCRHEGRRLVSDDASALWEAAGQPGPLDRVCPQRFRAAIAPHLAARAERKRVDPRVFRSGLRWWRERSDVVIVEGIGGLLSPATQKHYVLDVAVDFGFPLVIVARNALGTINHTLLTAAVAALMGPRGGTAGVVLNDTSRTTREPSAASNRRELEARLACPVLAQVGWRSKHFSEPVDWMEIARRGTR
jgi:dethiobiotin synthetase